MKSMLWDPGPGRGSRDPIGGPVSAKANEVLMHPHAQGQDPVHGWIVHNPLFDHPQGPGPALFGRLEDESKILLRAGGRESIELLCQGGGGEGGHRGVGVVSARMATAIVCGSPWNVLLVRHRDAVHVGTNGEPVGTFSCNVEIDDESGGTFGHDRLEPGLGDSICHDARGAMLFSGRLRMGMEITTHRDHLGEACGQPPISLMPLVIELLFHSVVDQVHSMTTLPNWVPHSSRS